MLLPDSLCRCCWIGVLFACASAVPFHAMPVRYQAEDATLLGSTYIDTSGSGYDGTGFARGFDNDWANRVLFDDVDVSPGLYELVLGYSSPYGQKGYDFSVGGETGSGFFSPTAADEFIEDSAGLFELQTGQETIEIGGSWGYYHVDYAELRPYVPPPTSPVTPALSNPNASPVSWELVNYLASQYGSKTLAGQQVHQRSGYVDAAYLAKSNGCRCWL